MAAVTVATVAKKVAVALASNKKGRKFIGYVIGIAVFILCIPILVVYCVFGWMAGSGEMDINSAAVNAVKDVPGVQAIQDASDKIEASFSALGLPAEDIKKAQVISLYYFPGRVDEEGFLDKLGSCFTETTAEKTVYTLINETFGITITEDEMQELDRLYGVTPARKSSGGGR